MIEEALSGDRQAIESIDRLRQSLSYGPVLYTFYPNETFAVECFQSTYVKDETYFVREARDGQGNLIDSPIAQAVGIWADQGKVRL